METKDILKKLDRIENLPTLPAIAMEVNRMLEDYNTSIKQLSSAVERDQSLVFKMLKLVNSAFFGLRSKVGNIPHAITLLGFNTVRNAVVSVSIIDAFSDKEGLEGFEITDFWIHSVGVAVTSKYLAEMTRLHTPDDCFIGGLLHDIGKIVLAQYFQDLFKTVWRSVQEDNLSFYDAEKRDIPIDHARIGGHLAKKWQLPVGLVDAIRYHHTVNNNASDPNLLMIINLADIIVNTCIADSKGKLELSSIHSEVVKAMRSPLDTLSDWLPEVSKEIESACKFFLEELK